MSPEARQQLGEKHDSLVKYYNEETDPLRANKLLEEIAAIEIILINSQPPRNEPVEGWETED